MLEILNKELTEEYEFSKISGAHPEEFFRRKVVDYFLMFCTTFVLWTTIGLKSNKGEMIEYLDELLKDCRKTVIDWFDE